MVTRVVTVNDILEGHVGLDLECFDRIYLNGWVHNLRVSRGGIAKLGGHWLDSGRRVPCFLPEALDELIEAELPTLADPDPDNARQRHATLTDAGADRYTTLSEREELR